MTVHIRKDSIKNHKQVGEKGGNLSSVGVISSVRSARKRGTNTRQYATVAAMFAAGAVSVNPVGSGGVGQRMLFIKR